jgi:serine/threonine protein kinase
MTVERFEHAARSMIHVQLPNGNYRYNPNEPLGGLGGFGQAFAGVGNDNAQLAIKKLHLSAEDAAHRELAIAAKLRRRDLQYVIPVIDSGECDGNYFIVMSRAEYNLQQWIHKNGQQNANATVKVLLDILRGLQEVDDLVHRDLKPKRLMAPRQMEDRRFWDRSFH